MGLPEKLFTLFDNFPSRYLLNSPPDLPKDRKILAITLTTKQRLKDPSRLHE